MYTVPMERGNVFIAGTVLVLLTTLAFVVSILFSQSRTPEKDTGSYQSFSGGTGQFSSLTPSGRRASDSDTLPSLLTHWGTDVPRSTERAVPMSTTKAPTTSTPRTTHSVQQEFRSLIGESLLERAAQQSTDSSYTAPYDPYDSGLWFTGFNDTYAPVDAGKTETDTQQALRAYGNALGGALTTFTTAHSDQVAVLDTFMNAREDQQARSAVATLADDYHQLADTLESIPATGPAAGIHAELVPLYRDISNGFDTLLTAHNDEAMLENILAYNAISENVARFHVRLVKMFSAYGVVFEEHEAGRIFSFTPPFGSELVE